MSHLQIEDVDKTILGLANHLHFSCYFFQPGFKNSLEILFHMAKNLGLTTSLDVQWDPLEKWDLNLNTVLPYVDLFIPNEIELQKLTKKPDLESALKAVKNKSKFTIVKCGNRGSVLCYGNKIVEKAAFLNTNVIDTIGAGDSFNSGFITKFLKGKSPEECQIFANLIGAVSTTQSGGTKAFENFEKVMEIAKEKFNYTTRR